MRNVSETVVRVAVPVLQLLLDELNGGRRRGRPPKRAEAADAEPRRKRKGRRGRPPKVAVEEGEE